MDMSSSPSTNLHRECDQTKTNICLGPPSSRPKYHLRLCIPADPGQDEVSRLMISDVVPHSRPSAIDDIIKYLPADIQAVIRHPPSLSEPSTFLPAFRLVAPYFKYLIVLVAFYIVWTVIAGVMGYFFRFMRFWAKLAPILGIIAWVMASSGQGSLPEVMELVKQWVGISDRAAAGIGAGGQQPPGIAQLAGLFGLGDNANARAGRTGTKRSTRSSTRRANKGSAAGSAADMDFANILRSATGTQSDDDWQDTVQGYVKQALAKASGLEWLFGQPEPPKTNRRKTR